MTTAAYSLYGLGDRNPFYYQPPLDPLKCPGDESRVLTLNGFFAKEKVDEFLAARVAANGPAFIVVSGRKDTGRTSIANYLLHVYLQKRGVARDDFIGVTVTGKSHLPYDWLRRAARELRYALKRQETPYLEAKPQLEALSEIHNNDDFAIDLRDATATLALELERNDPPNAFGVLFESIVDESLIPEAKDAFRDAPCLVVFTHDAYTHAQTAGPQLQDLIDDWGSHLVRLEPLDSRQIRMLAEERWRQSALESRESADEHPCPFEPEGVEAAFDDKHGTPIKTALRLLAWALDRKLKQAVQGNEAWPDNEELMMTGQWLMNVLETGRTYPR